MTKTMSIAGTTLELEERGDGRPLLFLHAGEGLAPERPWLELLSRDFQVIAPWHPGYGNSPLIDGSGSVDDLAYEADVNRTYLSKLEKGVSYPGLEIIAKIANALGIEPAELLVLPPRKGKRTR